MTKATNQFVRLKGYPRGAPRKRHTLGSILAEGLRHPSHTAHIPGDSHAVVHRIDSPLSDPEELGVWIEAEMEEARNVSRSGGRTYSRKLRSDALAIGTVIASLPETVEEFDLPRFDSFAHETTQWMKDFLEPYEMLVHFRLEHFDELHPHIHLWFTPKPNEIRASNWALNTVCCQNKSFYHELQKRFFDDVGNQFFDQRARPFEERKSRIPRWYAVSQRDEQFRGVSQDGGGLVNLQGEPLAGEVPNVPPRDFLMALKEASTRGPKDYSADIARGSSPGIGGSPMSGVEPNAADRNSGVDDGGADSELIQLVDAFLATLTHEQRQSLPTIKSEIDSAAKKAEKSALESRPSGKESSEPHIKLGSSPKRMIQKYQHEISELKSQKQQIEARAQIAEESVAIFHEENCYQSAITAIIQSAYRHGNRAAHLDKKVWEMLVIEEALYSDMAKHDNTSSDYGLLLKAIHVREMG